MKCEWALTIHLEELGAMMADEGPKSDRRSNHSSVVLLPPAIKVLHVSKYYAPYHGGIETQLQHLLAQLSRHCELQVVVAGHDHQCGRENVEGIDVLRLPTLVTVASTPFCRGLSQTIAASRADLVHLHLPNPAAVMALFLSGYRGPVVISHHSDIIRQKGLRLVVRPLQRWIMRRSSAICVASPDYLMSSRELADYRHKCHVIPFGIPIRELTSAQASRAMEIRRQYPGRRVLALGRLVYYKGFEYLIRAMDGIDAHLLLIGEGPLKKRLDAVTVAAGVADRVHFLGEVEEVEPYYEASDVFVLPSIARSEAFGIVQIEAMLRGKPVINTDLASGVKFVSPHGLTGITVPPANVDALRRAIAQLLADDDLRRLFGNEARRRVEVEFSDLRMAEQTMNLYYSVLNIANKVPADPASAATAGVGTPR
jgi:glycosyltransferase involved in cell wall biosynthesis